ncbi:NAD(P)-binding protein [Neoconidiobolus thromboides FSU 785]|nr:NAD(P)-binding protein [Neoconidiobolus thromboides FSU 785]
MSLTPKYSNKAEESLLNFATYFPLPYIVKAVMFSPYYYFLGEYSNAEKHANELVQQHLKNHPNEENKVAIVTGGNTGIGFETAHWLVKAKFHVILACRSQEKAEVAIEKIKSDCGLNSKIEFIALDLTSFDSVKSFVKEFESKDLPLNLLINNAGIMKIPEFERSKDGFELTFQVNYLSHFLLYNLLKDKLIATNNSKLINLSSLAHYMASDGDFEDINNYQQYNDLAHYSKAKAAVVMSTYAFKRHISDQVQFHPGVVKTELFRYDSMADKAVDIFGNYFMKTPLQGAMTTLRLALLDNIPKDSLYFADELPMQPTYWTKDIELQDKLWNLSKKLTCI